MQNAPNEQEFERSNASKILLGALTTFVITLCTKVITMLLASQTATDVMIYLSTNYGTWFTLLAATISGGFWAQWQPKGGKK